MSYLTSKSAKLHYFLLVNQLINLIFDFSNNEHKFFLLNSKFFNIIIIVAVAWFKIDEPIPALSSFSILLGNLGVSVIGVVFSIIMLLLGVTRKFIVPLNVCKYHTKLILISATKYNFTIFLDYSRYNYFYSNASLRIVFWTNSHRFWSSKRFDFYLTKHWNII